MGNSKKINTYESNIYVVNIESLVVVIKYCYM